MGPLVRTAALNGYVELCHTLGIDPRDLIKRVGLDVAGLAAQDRWISGAAVVELLELSAATAGHEDFGLRLAESRRLSSLGPIGLVVREEPDVRSAVGLLLQHEHMFNEVLHSRLSEHNGLATLKVELRLDEAMQTRQAAELVIAALHLLLRGLTPQWQPLSVCFEHTAPADATTHRRIFGPVLDFGREFHGIVFYAGALDAPNALSDPQLRTYARQYFESIATPRQDTTLPDRVRELIEVLLPTGRCSVEQVARSLGVDRRTVHRRLADSGDTYTSLLNATRMHLAERFVAHPRHSLTEVAHLLGFSMPSAFSHWFKEQFGCSPSEWRNQRGTSSGTDAEAEAV
ncbi:AraC family transcriptional regulator ligand-binding domain-containing protein [Streptomyces sp. NPDC056669]|uniref:AraC family transcriptional regulator ligand-binding domain-containing protein n=1 Tax=Streptomyces sp. NPDC056669 TaxID=3345903 RepID=UPI00368C2D07